MTAAEIAPFVSKKRIRIQIPQTLFDRMSEEMQFIGADDAGTCVRTNEQFVVRSKGDLLKWAIHLYIEALDGGDPEIELPESDEKASSLRFVVLSAEYGRWMFAIRQRWAADEHDLARRALSRYFDKIDQRHAADLMNYAVFSAMSPNTFLSTLRNVQAP